jgi:cyclic pyranopterin phosphate synthase
MTDTAPDSTPDGPSPQTAGSPEPRSVPAELSHVRADGAALMVDVSDKPVTKRRATATATLRTRPDVIALLLTGQLPKGEALAVARVAGILGAKQTSALIPLCHPLPISGATIDFTAGPDHVVITATVKTTGVTGVEMEALTSVSVAALTLYDMIKAVDKHAVIDDIRVLAKSGGKSGDWSTE